LIWKKHKKEGGELIMTEARFVLYHKQPTSARMRFMVFETGSVLSGSLLPALSLLEDAQERDYDSEKIVQLPTNGLLDVVKNLGISASDVRMSFPDMSLVDTAKEKIPVHGVAFTTIDPPIAQVENTGAKFIDMTQARQLSAIDMEILRRIYVHAMEG
jgi:hypothetical protein